MGDFFHFVDIYTSLTNNEKLKQYKFISIIHADMRYEQVKSKIQEIEIIDDYLIKDTNPEIIFSQYPQLEEAINTAEQIIQISAASFPSIMIDNRVSSNALMKFIGEHELSSPQLAKPFPWKIYSLGLSEGCWGSKIKLHSREQPETTISEIAATDKTFVDALFHHTKTDSITDLVYQNFIIPAYFNHGHAFVRFILFLAINQDFPKHKNVIFYVSGIGNEIQLKEKFATEFAKNKNQFINSDVHKIEIIDHKKEYTATFEVNPHGNRIFRLFNGFYINNRSYTLIYQQALIAGISGDNSLELAISTFTLPFYYSTNDINGKSKTRDAIAKIINKMDIPEETKSTLFQYFWRTRDYVHNLNNAAERFQQLNLGAIINQWTRVVMHLSKHHNFYNKLETIFLLDLPPNHRPTKFQCDTFFSKKTNPPQVINHPRKCASLISNSIFSLNADNQDANTACSSSATL